MLEEKGIVKHFKDGSVIFLEGDFGEEMYVIRSGKVKIFRERPEGEVSLTTLNPRDFFGEMALFADRKRSASAQAIGDTELIAVSKIAFEEYVNDPVVLNILEEMSKRIADVDDKLESLSVKDQVRKEHLSSLITQRRWFV